MGKSIVKWYEVREYGLPLLGLRSPTAVPQRVGDFHLRCSFQNTKERVGDNSSVGPRKWRCIILGFRRRSKWQLAKKKKVVLVIKKKAYCPKIEDSEGRERVQILTYIMSFSIPS
ncbi:hypothetical protein IC582_017944 [Cucumis melo]